MNIAYIMSSIKKKENEQIKMAKRNSIFTKAEELIFKGKLKTWGKVEKFLRGRKIDLEKLSEDEKKQKDTKIYQKQRRRSQKERIIG